MAERRKPGPKARKEHPLAFTVQGECFAESLGPEGRDRAAGPGRRGGEGARTTELRLFGSAMRVGFDRLLEGKAQVARVRVDTARTLGKPLAGEVLAFPKEHGADRAFDRMRTNLPRVKILKALARRRRRDGVDLLWANPVCASCTGRRISAPRDGISAQRSAAKVIGRGARKLPGRSDPDRRRRLAASREKLIDAAEEARRRRRAPPEGERPKLYGIAKRLGASRARERLVRCDGCPPWRRARASPRGDLAELRRYRWAEAAVSGIC